MSARCLSAAIGRCTFRFCVPAGRSVTSGPLPARYAPASGEVGTALGGGCVKARFPLGGTQHRVGAEGVLRDEGFNSESPCIAKLLIAVTVRRFYTASVESCRSRSTGPVMPLRQQVPVWLKAAQGQAQHVESCINLSEPCPKRQAPPSGNTSRTARLPWRRSRTGDFTGMSQDLLFRRQLVCDLLASQVFSTPRTRVPDGLHLKCAGSVRGKQTSLQRLAPG
jgi:hypothetical protein